MAATAFPFDQMQGAAREATGLLKALSNPDRLLILCHLAQGEARVGELEEVLGIVQPTLSQQLTVLREEQLVSTRRDGKNIYYSLASTPALAVIETLYRQFCCDVAAQRPSRSPSQSGSKTKE